MSPCLTLGGLDGHEYRYTASDSCTQKTHYRVLTPQAAHCERDKTQVDAKLQLQNCCLAIKPMLF